MTHIISKLKLSSYIRVRLSQHRLTTVSVRSGQGRTETSPDEGPGTEREDKQRVLTVTHCDPLPSPSLSSL